MSETQTWDDSSRFVRAQGLVASEIEEQIVVLNIDSGHFFSLNPVGARIWEMLATPQTEQQICSAMLARFDVENDECRAQVREFVDRMLAHGLVMAA